MKICLANATVITHVKALQEETGLNHIHLKIKNMKKRLQRKVMWHEDTFFNPRVAFRKNIHQLWDYKSFVQGISHRTIMHKYRI